MALGPRDPLDALRRLATQAVLLVFVVSVLADIIDDELLGNRHTVDPTIYALVTTLIGALFAAELLKRGRNGHDR
jgi:hypothetical protein